MGELTKSKLSKYAIGTILIETGTYYGGTVNVAIDSGFTTIHTIEIDEHLVKNAISNFKMYDEVYIHHGDSPDILKKICANLSEPATFWLDGHYSGEKTGFSTVYGHCPLLEEIASINTSECKDHVILIDDCRLLGIGEDWPTHAQVTDALFEINENYRIFYIHGYEKNDNRKEIVHPYDILIATTHLKE
jgi:hypothetical protein